MRIIGTRPCGYGVTLLGVYDDLSIDVVWNLLYERKGYFLDGLRL
jgi:hypothetical protein